MRWGYANPAFAAAIADRLRAERYDVAQFEFIEMANLMPLPRVPTILTVHQLGFAAVGPEWRARGGGLGAGAQAFHRYLRDLDFELRGVGRAHRVVIMSAEDAERAVPPGAPDLVNPVGVDRTEFRPRDVRPPPAPTLVFVGHFEHPRNPDAARFLVDDVLPRIGRPVRLQILLAPRPPPIAPGSPLRSAGSTPSRAFGTARCARGCSGPPRPPIAGGARRCHASSNVSTCAAWSRRFPTRAVGGSHNSGTPS